MIKANRVEEIFLDCLYTEAEVGAFSGNGISGGALPAGGVDVHGILNRFILNPVKLDLHRAEITTMLMQLPEQFMKSKGGGWSFLEAARDNTGEQWTGLHRTMDQLFTLGQAIGLVKSLMPREVWDALPGGMPYYVVDDTLPVPDGAAPAALAAPTS